MAPNRPKSGFESGVSTPASQPYFCKIELVLKLGALTPYDFSLNQLKTRVEVCQRLVNLLRKDLPLKQIITCDEKWVCYVKNYIRKRQWVPRTVKARPTPKAPFHQKKCKLSVWWGSRGLIH